MTTTMQEALEKDTTVYADLDEETGLFCVFGDNSGFAYECFVYEVSADEFAENMRKDFERKRLEKSLDEVIKIVTVGQCMRYVRDNCPEVYRENPAYTAAITKIVEFQMNLDRENNQ